MKKMYCVFVIMLMTLTSPLASTLATGSDNTEPMIAGAQQYEKGYRYNAGGWIYLHIEGKPYERGYQHGYLLSDEIVDMMNRWSNIVHEKNILKRLNLTKTHQHFTSASQQHGGILQIQSEATFLEQIPRRVQGRDPRNCRWCKGPGWEDTWTGHRLS